MDEKEVLYGLGEICSNIQALTAEVHKVRVALALIAAVQVEGDSQAIPRDQLLQRIQCLEALVKA